MNISSIVETFRSRLKSPFVTSFIISFIIWNWKSFAYFIYTENKIDFLNNIENYLSNNYLSPPLIVAFCYSCILPYLNVVIEIVTSRAQIIHLRNLQSIENEKINLLNKKSDVKEIIENNNLTSKEVHDILANKK